MLCYLRLLTYANSHLSYLLPTNRVLSLSLSLSYYTMQLFLVSLAPRSQTNLHIIAIIHRVFRQFHLIDNTIRWMDDIIIIVITVIVMIILILLVRTRKTRHDQATHRTTLHSVTFLLLPHLLLHRTTLLHHLRLPHHCQIRLVLLLRHFHPLIIVPLASLSFFVPYVRGGQESGTQYGHETHEQYTVFAQIIFGRRFLFFLGGLRATRRVEGDGHSGTGNGEGAAAPDEFQVERGMIGGEEIASGEETAVFHSGAQLVDDRGDDAVFVCAGIGRGDLSVDGGACSGGDGTSIRIDIIQWFIRQSQKLRLGTRPHCCSSYC
mmetsp:Transcript_2345/g.4294  ORF Transcript_2345/g.4294 Transcript_2345/m.4294 type:complete len:321 (-) Transcript_2345:1878-2840(-)